MLTVEEARAAIELAAAHPAHVEAIVRAVLVMAAHDEHDVRRAAIEPGSELPVRIAHLLYDQASAAYLAAVAS